MPAVVGDEVTFSKLNKTQRAILNMQAGPLCYLYAFTAQVPPEAQKHHLALLGILAVGIHFYAFQRPSDEEFVAKHPYSAWRAYAPMIELEFTENGKLVFPQPKTGEQAAVRTLAELTGFDLDAAFVPADAFDRIANAAQSPGARNQMTIAYLQSILQNLQPHEKAEVDAFLRSEAAASLMPPSPPLSADDAAQAFQDPVKMAEMAAKIEEIRARIQKLDLPPAARQVFMDILNTQFSALAGFMQWQAESDALQNTRKNKKNSP